MNQYSLNDAAKAFNNVKKRPFETYILGPFLILYAAKLHKGKSLRARRILASAGMYIVLRNLDSYKKLMKGQVDNGQN